MTDSIHFYVEVLVKAPSYQTIGLSPVESGYDSRHHPKTILSRACGFKQRYIRRSRKNFLSSEV